MNGSTGDVLIPFRSLWILMPNSSLYLQIDHKSVIGRKRSLFFAFDRVNHSLTWLKWMTSSSHNFSGLFLHRN